MLLEVSNTVALVGLALSRRMHLEEDEHLVPMHAHRLRLAMILAAFGNARLPERYLVGADVVGWARMCCFAFSMVACAALNRWAQLPAIP